MMLSIYDSCSPCYRSMLTATMRYCIVWGPYGNRRYGDQHMGTIDMGTIDIRRYQYNDIRRYIQQCVIACLGIGGVHMYHHSRQVGVGLRYCDTYQLRLTHISLALTYITHGFVKYL